MMQLDIPAVPWHLVQLEAYQVYPSKVMDDSCNTYAVAPYRVGRMI